MSVEVAQATPDRLPAVASTIGRALVTEPMLRWPLGVDADLEARSIRNFEHYLEPLIELGIVWATADTLGAAVWAPPARTEAFEDAQRKSQPSIDALTDDRGRRFSVFWGWVGSMLPDEPLWYLDLIGVAPERARRGRRRSWRPGRRATSRTTSASGFASSTMPTRPTAAPSLVHAPRPVKRVQRQHRRSLLLQARC